MDKESAQVKAANRINITYVSVTKSDGEEKYSLEAQWETEQAYPQQDSLWMMVRGLDGDLQKHVVKFDDESGSMDFVRKNPEQSYEFIISDDETGPKPSICTPIKLLFASYEDIQGSYEGDILRLSWKSPDENISFGESLVIQDGEKWKFPKINEAIPRFARQTSLTLHRGDYDANAVVRAILTPCNTKISCGPQADSGPVYLNNPKISGVEVVNGTTLRISYTSTHGDDANARVQPVLQLEGRTVCEGTRQAIKGAADQKQLDWDMAETPWREDWPRCTLVLYHCTDAICTISCTGENSVALCSPTLVEPYADQQGIRLCWEYAGAGEQFTVEGGGGSSGTTYKRQITMSCSSLADLDGKFTVRAGRGPRSASVTAFQPGFYPTGTGMRFFAKSSAETTISVPLGDGFFSKPLTSKLTKGSLEVDTENVLSIDKSSVLTQSELKEWFNLLGQNNITPSGYYRMRQLLARLAFAENEDVLRAYCGLEKGMHSADIFPGALLGIQAAAYQFQTGSRDAENAGMTPQTTDWYTISLSELADGQVLCMDSFINRVQQDWMPFNGNVGNSFYLSGGLDFFLKTVRKPYMRICYPLYFQLGDHVPTPYNSDNVVILTASSFAELETAAKTLMDTPTAEISVPHIICRSRATVSLRQTIYLNGTATQVPVGAVLSELVQPYSACYGSSAFSGVSLRRKAIGEWVPVQLQWFKDEVIGSLPLLDGDRIEVK